MTDVNAFAYVGCSHQAPRGARINLVVVHTNEGPEGPTSAEGLAGYLHRSDVVPGYHIVVDENSGVRCAADSQRVNGAGGVNDRSLHVCITGYAAQSAAQWSDPASTAARGRAEDVVRQWCTAHGVPFRKLTAEQVRDGVPGVCGHVDVSKYHAASQGHSDPGAAFPWADFMAGSLEEDDMFTDEDRDKVNWIFAILKEGGYGARGDGKPSRVEATLNELRALRKALGK